MADLKLELPSGVVDAFVAHPDGAGPHPGVVVIHEAFGLNDDIRSIARKFAGWGYVALAPDLIQGGRIMCIVRALREVRSGAGDTVQQLEESVDWLAALDEIDAARLGAIGFCMGGGFAFLVGLTGKVAAVAPNYGDPPGELARLEQSCPVVASYGDRDLVYRRHAKPVKQVLDRAGIPNDVKSYPDAGHSFMNQSAGHRLMKTLSRPIMKVGYRAEQAEDAWGRIERFFGEHV